MGSIPSMIIIGGKGYFLWNKFRRKSMAQSDAERMRRLLGYSAYVRKKNGLWCVYIRRKR